MKLRRLATAFALAGLLGGTASAQQFAAGTTDSHPSYFSLEQEPQAHLVSHEDDYYLASQPSEPMPNGAVQAMPDSGMPMAGGNYANYGGRTYRSLNDPWRLFDGPRSERGLNVTGWLSQSYYWNPDNPTDRFNGPTTFNDRSNEYQMNQAYFVFQQEVDTLGDGFDIGGRCDLLYGTDWRFTPALGLELNQDGTRNWNQDSRFYGLALPQLYAEAAWNNLSMKVGHFYTIVGYETVTAVDNFFSSHPYCMQYGEPFTHTGALWTYTFNDRLTASAGFHRGWNAWEDPEGTLGYLGGFTFQVNERDTLAGSCVWSRETGVGGGISDRQMYSAVYISKLTERFTTVSQVDIGHQNSSATGGPAEWYGTNAYWFYTLNDRWSLGWRNEWFRDDDGFRVYGFGTSPAGVGPPPSGWSGGGYAGDFYAETFGLNCQATANWLVRTELRFDWYSGANGTVAGYPRPYDFGTDSSQTLLGVNLLGTW